MTINGQNMIDSFLNISALYPAEEYKMGEELKFPFRGQLTTLIGKVTQTTGEIVFSFKAQNQNPTSDEIVAEVHFHPVYQYSFTRENTSRHQYIGTGVERIILELFVKRKFFIKCVDIMETLKDVDLKNNIEFARRSANEKFAENSGPTFCEAFADSCIIA